MSGCLIVPHFHLIVIPALSAALRRCYGRERERERAEGKEERKRDRGRGREAERFPIKSWDLPHARGGLGNATEHSARCEITFQKRVGWQSAFFIRPE